MPDPWLDDYPTYLTEAPRRRHPAWQRWTRDLKPWAVPATIAATIGIILVILGDRPGLGLLMLWVAVPVLVIGGGVER